MGTQPVDTSTLHHYLHLLKRRKWILIQAIVLSTLAAVLFSLHQQRKFAASAEILINQQDVSLLVGSSVPVYRDPIRSAQTAATIARVPIVAEGAVKHARVARTGRELLRSSSVNPEPNADLLEFRVVDRVPKIAVVLATAYAREFINYRRSLSTEQIRKALRDVGAKLAALRATGDTHSDYYLSLLAKEQQLKTLETLQTSDQLVRPAQDAVQVQPQPLRNAVIGFLLGVGLGLALAFLRDALDTRVRTAEAVAERINLPLLGRLAQPPARLRNEGKLVMLDEPDSLNAEAFRVLRTNIDFVNLDRGAHKIMITSGVEAEGKSTTIANLAVAFARAGRRVIAVDLDLRRPLLHKLFRLHSTSGITQVALGLIDLEDAIVPVTFNDLPFGDPSFQALSPNGNDYPPGILEVLPAGALPPEVGEFVGGRRLQEILESLAGRADLILIDSPPVLRVGDAMTLSAKVDALLIAVHMDKARRQLLDELRRVLERCPADKLGFILTGTSVEAGYGYGYGYGNGGSYATRGRAEREVVA